jgi:26S proteasome regulatory subunit N5
LTVLLARNHEKIAETAPSTSSTPAAPKPVTTGDKDKAEKPKPVTSKEHLETAADLMSDIQVETYSSMDKREKTEL